MRQFLKILTLILFFGVVSCSKDSDSGDQGTIAITVTTSNFSTNIDENLMNGQVIGTITGSTNQGSVIFSITEQIPTGAFSINATSGELTIADETIFDFETNPTITGIVKVANGSVFQNSNVIISLNDINEVNIFSGDAELFTQQEVDDFGANNYTHIAGNLRIGSWGIPNSSIVNLSSLTSITTIGGYLNISSNMSLTDLNGLNNISSISGDRLQILENTSLTTINVFQNLTNIPGTLFIGLNESLVNLDGLENITSIGESLLIQNNISIEDIDGINNLLTVGSNVSSVYIDIHGNDSLLNVDGLHNLTHIEGTLWVSNNISLTNINGLSNFVTISEDLAIGGNTVLTSLNGLHNIISVGQRLSITENPLITNIDELSNITSTGSDLVIAYNTALTNLDGLQNLTITGFDLSIIQNSSLTNLDGLDNLTTVEGHLDVIANSTLANLCGLQTLLIGNGLNFTYEVTGNLYNPSQQDIIDGNCSL